MDCCINTWADALGKNANLHQMNIDYFDCTLGLFYADLQKRDGTDYEHHYY